MHQGDEVAELRGEGRMEMPARQLSSDTLALLRCPRCGAALSIDREVRCHDCGNVYPIVDGIPILIDGSKSLFDPEDFVMRRPTTWPTTRGVRAWVSKMLPSITSHIRAQEVLCLFEELVVKLEGDQVARVLVVGGAVAGKGMDAVIANTSIEMIETDVSFGPRTTLVCDAHDLPFVNESLDGVIVQNVLSSVLDPVRCVAEMHRVLRPGGIVYAEIPFMQQVYGGRYDFTRFTFLGQRYLFRWFEEIKSGASAGPGTALAWAYQYFLVSFTESSRGRAAMRALARMTAFWLREFDRLLIDKPSALEAASAHYFLGRKSDRALTPKELIARYPGA